MASVRIISFRIRSVRIISFHIRSFRISVRTKFPDKKFPYKWFPYKKRPYKKCQAFKLSSFKLQAGLCWKRGRACRREDDSGYRMQDTGGGVVSPLWPAPRYRGRPAHYEVRPHPNSTDLTPVSCILNPVSAPPQRHGPSFSTACLRLVA